MDKKSALAALAALGQDTRLEVFRLLVRAGAAAYLPAKSRLGSARCRTPCRPISRYSIMQVWCDRARRPVVRYVADMTGFRDLLAYLMEDCCNGAPELCRPVIQAVTCKC